MFIFRMINSDVNVVMIGTDVNTQGGISTVVSVLKNAGLFDKYRVEYISTHRDGGVIIKLAVLIKAWFRYLKLLLKGRVFLLHAHTASRSSFWRKTLFILPTFLARVPVVLHLHGAEFQLFYGSECAVLTRNFVHWVFENVNCVVVLSKSWEQWVHFTFPLANVKIIHNPINLPETINKKIRKKSLFINPAFHVTFQFRCIALSIVPKFFYR